MAAGGRRAAQGGKLPRSARPSAADATDAAKMPSLACPIMSVLKARLAMKVEIAGRHDCFTGELGSCWSEFGAHVRLDRPEAELLFELPLYG